MQIGKFYKSKLDNSIIKCSYIHSNNFTFNGTDNKGIEYFNLVNQYFDEYNEITATSSQIGIPFIEGNIIKYIIRHRNKNGVEDLKKAKHYIDLLIQFEYENKTDK